MDKIQPAVKKETKRVAVYTAVGTVAMWCVFGILHLALPESVPFDYRIFLSGIVGGGVAVLNFFLMGVTVQKAASETAEDTARMRLKSSYSQRMLLQILWVIAAVVAPCFQFAAGIAPLLFPSFGIRIAALIPGWNKR